MLVKKPKIILVILDGFGMGIENKAVNAIYAARTPFLDYLFKEYPWIKLSASEKAVGLEDHQFGNSEIGHLTIGSGRVFLNANQLIFQVLNEKQLNEFLAPYFKENHNHIINLFGIYSSGLVHGNKAHMDALIKYFSDKKYYVNLHLYSDGRDTKKQVFLDDLKTLVDWINPEYVRVASVSGRYYSMDRDQNWDRLNLAFQAFNFEGKSFSNPINYVDECYKRGLDDEMIYPAYNTNAFKNKLDESINFFTNYRPDRVLGMAQVFKEHQIDFLSFLQFQDFENLGQLLKKDEEVVNNLDQVLFKHHYSQLRIAETEKYAHVTYFFDGGRLVPNPLKKEVLIPSEKIDSHAKKPSMKAVEITDYILEHGSQYDFILVNYANPDMLGHTGDFEATKKGIEIIDAQLEKIYNRMIKGYNNLMVLTADHGNADLMYHDHQILKTHTTALVPFLITDKKVHFKTNHGSLANIAPTILSLLNIKKPQEMTYDSLINGEENA